MLANLATSILDKERVVTTVAKAKEVRGVVERLITYGKKGGNNIGAIRRAAKTVRDKTVLKKLFDDIALSYQDREGGYTRIVKLGERRGDNAEMSIIELVGRNGDEPRRRDKKSRRTTATKPAKAKAKAPTAAPVEPKTEKPVEQPEATAEEQTGQTPASEPAVDEMAEQTPEAQGASEPEAATGSEEKADAGTEEKKED
jgi:large subunit ribosomal protein L17